MGLAEFDLWEMMDPLRCNLLFTTLRQGCSVLRKLPKLAKRVGGNGHYQMPAGVAHRIVALGHDRLGHSLAVPRLLTTAAPLVAPWAPGRWGLCGGI